MNIPRFATVLACSIAATACANYRPIVDQQSIGTVARYETDLSDCQRYAEHVSPAGGAAVGAILGAALGVAIGAIAGDADLGIYAAGGALGGAVGGLGSGAEDQQDVIRNCLRGRGYSVLK
jgi:hypothetical protein